MASKRPTRTASDNPCRDDYMLIGAINAQSYQGLIAVSPTSAKPLESGGSELRDIAVIEPKHLSAPRGPPAS
jgi:hypothetical protein